VSSLLEVGTGFHPDLTGRDNIFLNGTILGMTKKEVERKFDQIVDFSGVEKFLDTPVKRYSSGMRVRLAFAVSAHLEPEVLLIDEVLAVGDAEFQKKCLNKMEEVGEEGRTVLFVSHSMPAITRLCPRAILLDNGQVIADGPSHSVVGAYLNQGTSSAAAREWQPDDAPGNDVARLLAVRIRKEDGTITDVADIREPVGVEMEYEVLKPDHKMLSYIYVLNDKGIRAFASVDLSPEWQNKPRPKGHYTTTAWIPGNLLSEGTLFIGASMRSTTSRNIYFNVADAVAFQVVDAIDSDSARGSFTGRMSGVVRPLLTWNTEFDQNISKANTTSSFDRSSQ
jgi:lipopolysaccharide transport system ATP-binding protein